MNRYRNSLRRLCCRQYLLLGAYVRLCMFPLVVSLLFPYLVNCGDKFLSLILTMHEYATPFSVSVTYVPIENKVVIVNDSYF